MKIDPWRRRAMRERRKKLLQEIGQWLAVFAILAVMIWILICTRL